MAEIEHSDQLILDHTEKLGELTEQGNNRKERLEKLEEKTENTDKNVRYLLSEMGIKGRSNGDRDAKIRENEDKISKLADKTDEEDKTLREDIGDLKENQAKIVGLLEQKNQKLGRSDKFLLFIFSSFIAIITVLLGVIFR